MIRTFDDRIFLNIRKQLKLLAKFKYKRFDIKIYIN